MSGIRDLTREISAYERQFKMSSAEFRAKMKNGQITDTSETFRWSALLKIQEEARRG
jgi:hypothetical protein